MEGLEYSGNMVRSSWIYISMVTGEAKVVCESPTFTREPKYKEWDALAQTNSFLGPREQ